ncbi:hypothetical protein WMF27_27005 [Sorangium sp. So ce281]|uniref:hypothetical protein n=1 Tax=unclassified Sorangium TaxID=2621164 RepID=UPI003F5E8D26
MMVFGAMAVMNSGCEEIVFNPIQNGGWDGPPAPIVPDDDEEVDDDDVDDADDGASGVHVIALRGSDVVPGSIPFTSSPAAWETPDALVLYFSNAVDQCAQPVIALDLDVDCDKAGTWQFILTIPPELNKPGLIDLSAMHIPFSKTVILPGCGGGSGVGPGHWGTLEIVSSDETSLFVKVRGAGDENWPVDGDHTVQRCGT